MLEIYALKASADLLRGKTDSEWTAKALAQNASYGEAYATPAYFYVITRRYREAIELLKKAVAIEPDLYSAHSELGVNLLRENKIQEAQQHLQIAYRGDPFSAPIVNTLRLIDSFDNFVVKSHLPDPNAPRAAAGAERAPRRIPARCCACTRTKPRCSIRTCSISRTKRSGVSKRYGFELKEPVIVELYPEHDDFAVRIAGLPGIGLLGVTFGYLVAMDSPTGERIPTSTGARRCGTSSRTCSRSRRRAISCRAGSAKACRCTRSGARGR